MICRNCGGKFSDELEKCPYCGTMNTKGAFGHYRKRLNKYKDNLGNLNNDAYNSLQELLIKSLVKGVLIVAICVIVGVGIGFILPRGYDSPAYEKELYQKIVWLDSKTAELNAAYVNDDLEAIDKLKSDDEGAIYNWEHYDIYTLMDYAEDFKAMVEEVKNSDSLMDYNVYRFAYGLELLYNPEAITNFDLDDEEKQKYQKLVNDVEKGFESLGFSKSDTSRLFESANTKYGIDGEQLKELLFGEVEK